VSQTDSLQWPACSCNDRLCLTLFSVRPPHHKAPFLSHPDNRCFSVRLRAVSPSRPAGQHRAAHRRRSRLAVGHRRKAAQCRLDGREHGATLNQVGSARFLSRHTLRGYRPLLFLLATMVGSPITLNRPGRSDTNTPISKSSLLTSQWSNSQAQFGRATIGRATGDRIGRLHVVGRGRRREAKQPCRDEREAGTKAPPITIEHAKLLARAKLFPVA
jgi:hypothetical protein